MRVLVVTPWFPSAASPGTGIFNLRDAELLALDHHVTVIHLYDPSLSPVPTSGVLNDTLHVRPVPFVLTRPNTVMKASKLIRALSAEHDLVHTMAFSALPVTKIALRGRKTPWVHTEHWSGLMVPPETVRAKLGARVLRPLLASPHEVVAVGETLAVAVNRYRTIPATIIGNQVSLTGEEGLPEPPPVVPERPLKLVSVGNLIDHKGVLEAVETVHTLGQQGVNATLRWAGTGPLKSQAERLANELGIEGRITFVGHLDSKQLAQLLREAHLFILPTVSETFGVALAEALGAGLPVVATGRGGHEGFLPRGASRLTGRTPEALARAVIDLINDTNRWSPAQIVAYAKQQFSEATRRHQYRDMYERALEHVRR